MMLLAGLPCMPCAANWLSSKRRRLDSRSGLSRCLGPVPTKSTSREWRKSVRRRLPRASRELLLVTSSSKTCARTAKNNCAIQGCRRYSLCGVCPRRDLAEEMIAGGMRAKLTCIDTRVLDASFAGREFSEMLLASLPAGVDPCGERGEFHSFVYGGPMLSREINVLVGKTVTQDHFVFADLTSG